MKKRTKIASLFLAMLLAFSLMAVTAAAYDGGHEHDCAVCSEEGIESRGPVRECPKCHGTAYLVTDEFHGVEVSWFRCACGWEDR